MNRHSFSRLSGSDFARIFAALMICFTSLASAEEIIARLAGGKTTFQFSRCLGLTLRHLQIPGQSMNGLNLDEGGLRDQPVAGITLEKIEINDIGPPGNPDGIKCSGLTGLTIRDCTISGWGGQGIVYRRDPVTIEVNIGSVTTLETFRFEKNRWFAEDRPEASRPKLPTEEREGEYGINPH